MPSGGSSDFEIRSVALDRIVECERFCLRQRPFARIAALAYDIKRRGQTTPLFVRLERERYELISGYRRREALAKAGVTIGARACVSRAH